MDSPKNDKAAASSASPLDSVAVPDSSIFSYISNLSPIKPVKAAPVVTGFPGLSSPPSVFTSPRLNPLREITYVNRSQCPQLSGAELCQQDVRGKKMEKGLDEFEKSKTKSCSTLTPCIEKEWDNSGSTQDQAASSSGCVDEYLVDAVEVNCENSAHSASLSLIQSGNMPQTLNDGTGLKEMEPKLNDKNDARQDAEKAMGAFPVTLELSGQDFQGKSSFNNKPVEKQGVSELPSTLCPKAESGMSVDHALEEQHGELSVAQHAGSAHKDEWDCVSQFVQESLQPIQGHEDCSETTREASNEPVENAVMHDSKGQHHCGMHRRCLLFEEAQQNTMANSPGSWSPSNVVSSSRLPASPADLEVFESSCLEISATSSGRQLVNFTQPIISMISPRNSGNPRSTVSKPSGIGLHLNSIVNAMPIGCNAIGSMKSAEKGYQGKKLVSTMGSHQPENTKNSSILSNVRDKLSASSEDGSYEARASAATSSLASQSPQIVKSSNDPDPLTQIEYQTNPCVRRKSISEHAHAVEELNQSSPKKKRKKALAANDGDGCKRCNCKKTKCLKLYCDCFAAGIYCDESCACRGCFNRPEYEDTVLETRQQIESRNPLAFAPKIVQRLTDSPANSNGEDGNNATPSSARHKRGCNCKKSMCLKKYCECYQANVGCSNGCRCEGCKNVYGKKEEYPMTKDVLSKGTFNEILESTFDEKLEMVASPDSLLQTELCNIHNLTPLTPSFQFSDHGKDASQYRFSTRRCFPSPESDLNFLPKSPVGSPGTSDNYDMLLNARKNIPGSVSCHQELDCSYAETVDEFAPRYEGLANVCDLMTLPNPPSTGMSCSASSKIIDWTTVSRAQLCPGSGHLSSVSSLRWRGSPITPVAQFGGTKLLQAVEFDEKLHNIMEDNMPDILKDTSTPQNGVKVSSPNKKRVSPPHNHSHELGSSSSARLRSGRKFILQAVPSFPPLTPCIDSKDSSSQNINDPKDCSSKK